MIVSMLVTLACVLGGILLMTLLYLLVVEVAAMYRSETAESRSPTTVAKDAESTGTQARQSLRAIINCPSLHQGGMPRFHSIGYPDCHLHFSVFGGNAPCAHGCVGLGSCARICPSDAIIVGKGAIFVSEACTGCGKCIPMCPKGLISLVPTETIQAPIPCAASGKNDCAENCAIATQNREFEYRNFPESAFQLLMKWGILKKKSR
jgi:Na+-translocating ferredoxin:NAD+ oxidoreductase subunit B